MSIHCGLEPELLEFGLDHPPHRLDAGDVHRPAVLFDPALEHGGRALLLCIDGLDHRLFGGLERGCWARSDGEEGMKSGNRANRESEV